MAFAAISMTAIVAMAAFVIDVGSWYQVSRQVQAAADAGATAAANDLPASPSQAASDATTYVNKNISGATTTTVTPYSGDPTKVKVTVSINAPTFFAKIFGINSVPVTASSAAKRVNGGGKWAIFADSTACGSGGFNDSGSNITVAGGTRTNSSFTMSGSNNTFGVSTYGGPNNCSLSKSGSSDTFNGAANPTADATNYPWPEPWPQSAAEIATYGIGCTFSGTNFSYSTSNSTIPSGTYCETGSVSISGSSNTCTCTFIASSVSISGSSEHFSPHYQDLLIDAYGANFNLSGSSQTFTGTIFVPKNNLGMSGSNNGLYNMFLEGLTVSTSGSGWLLTGTGPSMGYVGSQLVE
jgi:Flp pilus assembly protein TadG